VVFRIICDDQFRYGNCAYLLCLPLAYLTKAEFSTVMVSLVRFIFLRTCVKRSGVDVVTKSHLILVDADQGGNIKGEVSPESFENDSFWVNGGQETQMTVNGFKMYLALFLLRHSLLRKLRQRKNELVAKNVGIDVSRMLI